MNTLTYKGYTGTVDIDTKAGILFGRVLDLDAVLTFEAETVPETEQAFHDTIDDYLDWCAERGKNPDRPYSGQFRFRTSPDHHRMIALAAARMGKSINAWLDEIATREAERELSTR